jgi:hypothetical protein
MQKTVVIDLVQTERHMPGYLMSSEMCSGFVPQLQRHAARLGRAALQSLMVPPFHDKNMEDEYEHF